MITDNNQGQLSIKNKPHCLGYFESTRKLGRETFLRCYRWNKICFKFTDDLDRSRDRDKSDAAVLTNIITFYFCPNLLEPVSLCLLRLKKKIWSPDQTVWCLTVITLQYDGRQIKYKCWKWISIILLGCITLSKYILQYKYLPLPAHPLFDISNAPARLSQVRMDEN